MQRTFLRATTVVILALTLVGCQTTYPVVNAPGSPTRYQDPNSPGAVTGAGIESQDIISMTDRMLRDMLTSPRLAGTTVPPRVIVDAEYFLNESSTRLNKNVITDRLRIELSRAAQGRMIFVGRHFSDMVKSERDLKRAGTTDIGTQPLTKATLGGDFRLGGRITSLDSRSRTTGTMSRYNQISFEMVDLENGEIVWSGLYEFSKTAQDDVIYR